MAERRGSKEPELGLHPTADRVKIVPGATIAKRNDDVAEMDCPAIADGKLELCVQPAGSKSAPKKMKSVNSGDRPLYGYDALGTLTSLESGTGGGMADAYQYDLQGRLTNVTANGTAAAAYGFDAVGNLQSMRLGSGVTNLYQYDSRNRLTNLVWKLNSSSLASFAYTVASTGNRTALSQKR